ncbi:CHAT domain-containing protein [Mycena maculata]|uniref:CHAT domain-containing protein n=1 Tax=Mycena maculata TaxID=230809 RepID=A0AAD7HWK0_9AGAR|nr:CHAT domain-containing protein [Mycena maculata]
MQASALEDHRDADSYTRSCSQHLAKYENSDPEELECAIRDGKKAIELGSNDRYAFRNLATALGKQYDHQSGELKDLLEALGYLEQAIEKTSGRAERCEFLQEYATLRFWLYQRAGNLKDLDTAIKITKNAIAEKPSIGHLQNLGILLLASYSTSGRKEDLEEALENNQDALNLSSAALAWASFRNKFPFGTGLISTRKHQYAQCLQNMATSLREWFRHEQDFQNLWDALEYDSKAREIYPRDPVYAQNLALSYKALYDHTKDHQYLEKALKCSQEALHETADDHPRYRHCLHVWAVFLVARYKESQNQEDLKSARSAYNQSLKSNPWNDVYQTWSFNSAVNWEYFEGEKSDSSFKEAYVFALDLLPHILWIMDSFDVRQAACKNLDITNATSKAINVCIKHKDLGLAVQFAEKGLAVLFQYQWQLKNHAHKQGSTNVTEYSQNLPHIPQKPKEHMEKELRELLENCGQKNSKSFEDLQQVSENGPVVILNPPCHAIILCPQLKLVEVTLKIELKTLKDKKEMLEKLLHSCGRTRLQGVQESHTPMNIDIQKEFKSLLKWLWSFIVSPIYQKLESILFQKGGRLWWCPVGMFSGLPLHAAADDNLDKFIPSYTPSLGVLLHARNRLLSSTQKFCVVGVTHDELHHARKEVENIRAIVKDHQFIKFLDAKSTVEDVTAKLGECTWFHFAGHGSQDPYDAGRSFLQLYDGQFDLQTILKMSLPHSEFVFLAACHTAKGDQTLVNESLHLSGGFIAAGFRAAIGTMWTMDDEDGPEVARAVYSHLFKKAGTTTCPQVTDTAEALRNAVRQLRTQGVPYERWIPFVHIGV